MRHGAACLRSQSVEVGLLRSTDRKEVHVDPHRRDSPNVEHTGRPSIDLGCHSKCSSRCRRRSYPCCAAKLTLVEGAGLFQATINFSSLKLLELQLHKSTHIYTSIYMRAHTHTLIINWLYSSAGCARSSCACMCAHACTLQACTTSC